MTRLEDLNGNTIEVEWQSGGTNTCVPRRILYTGNTNTGQTPLREVEFSYDNDRTDVVRTFTGGVPFELGLLLRTIETFIKDPGNPSQKTLVKEYRLQYGATSGIDYSDHSNRALLTAVEECDGAGNCLPPTQLSWTQGDWMTNAFVRPTSGISQIPPILPDVPLLTGDFNGDGNQDYLKTPTTQHTWSAQYLQKDPGFVDTLALNEPTAAPGYFKTYADYDLHDPEARPGMVTYGNSVATCYRYDADSKLLRRTVTSHFSQGVYDACSERAVEYPGEKRYLDLAYDWTSSNLIEKITDKLDPTRTQGFAYSPAGELTQATGAYGTRTFTYHAGGALHLKDGIFYTYQGHRPVSGSDGSSFVYDANGNLLNKAQGTSSWILDWNLEDRLTSVNKDGAITSFTYDFAGQRLSKRDPDGTTTLYVGSSYEITTAPDGTEQHTKYIDGPSGRIVQITRTGVSLVSLMPVKYYAAMAEMSFTSYAYSALKTTVNSDKPYQITIWFFKFTFDKHGFKEAGINEFFLVSQVANSFINAWGFDDAAGERVKEGWNFEKMAVDIVDADKRLGWVSQLTGLLSDSYGAPGPPSMIGTLTTMAKNLFHAATGPCKGNGCGFYDEVVKKGIDAGIDGIGDGYGALQTWSKQEFEEAYQ